MKTVQLLMLASILTLGLFSACSKDDNSSSKDYTDVFYMDSYDSILYKMPLQNLTLSPVKDLVSMTGYGAGLVYNSKNDKIYFSEIVDTLSEGKIWSINPDGTEPKALVSGLLEPWGLAVDSKNSKIYWGDDNGKVSRSNLDGSSVEAGIFTVDGGGIRAIAIDSKNSKLYFFDVQHNSLYKSNLDGTNASVILDGYYGYAIAVDEANGKIYFDAQTDDESVSALYRANLDGSSPTLVDNTQSRIFGIAIDSKNSKVYWTGRDTYEIYKANLNGTNKETLASDLGVPRGIILR
jgi:DNA-binding beta-propeller fold protein YncE